MALTGTSIFLIFIVCRVSAWFMTRTKANTKSYQGKVQEATQKIISDLGWTALTAWTIVAILNMTLFNVDSLKTISAINSYIAQVNALLKQSWIVLLLLCVFALVAVVRFKRDVAIFAAHGTGAVVKRVGFVKVLFGLLATCTFVGAEANATLPANIATARAAKGQLTEAQLALFTEAKLVLLREAVRDILIQSASVSPPTSATVQAYNRAVYYVDPNLGDKPAEATSYTAPTSEREFIAAEAASADQVQEREAAVTEKSGALDEQDKLVNDIVKIVLNNGAFSPLKKEVFAPIHSGIAGLGNPILDSLLGAFLDPAFFNPVRDAVAKQANRLVRGEVDWAGARKALLDTTTRMRIALRPRMSSATPSGPRNHFGEPEWDAVRDQIDSIVAAGIRGKTPEMQESARDSVGRFSAVRTDLQILLPEGPGTASKEEAAFGRYLGRHAGYAALWGFGVIAVPPVDQAENLERISISGSAHRAGEIKDVIAAANGGDTEAASVLTEIGFDPKADANLSVPAIQAKLYEVHGAYPVDGYILYSQATHSGSAESARDYYRSDIVGQWIEWICPAGHGKHAPPRETS